MSDNVKLTNTVFIKSNAKKLGFDFCGISKAEFLKEEKSRFYKWLGNGYQGKMSYMGNHIDKRLDPTKLIEGAKSVISLLYNYHPATTFNVKGNYKIARYAYGKDYHFVIKEKLRELLTIIQRKINHVEGRVFVDSAPVLERQWAAKSGLGWIGKNTLLINRKSGSYYFIAEIILNVELIYDSPTGDFCGTCTRCIDACPTDALIPYQMDATKCISYLTIELKEEIPSEFKGKLQNWIFGCDICQEVCPWNRFAKPHNEPFFLPDDRLKAMSTDDWIEITEEVFQSIFKKSAVKRAKYEGIKRNINFVNQ